MPTPTAVARPDLDGIAARAEAATPGPWEWIGGETFVVDREYAPIYTDLESETAWIISCGIQQQGKVSSGCMAIRETDAAFIAAARADVPAPTYPRSSPTPAR